MSRQGFIQFNRSFIDNPIYDDRNAFNVFFHLLLLANHTDNTFIWNGKLITVKRGQLITGRLELSKKLHIKESTVYKVLVRLSNRNEIGMKSNNKNSLITIIKYEKYTTPENQSNSKVTTKEQQSNTINNDNNDNKLYAEIQTTKKDEVPLVKNPSFLGLFSKKFNAAFGLSVAISARAFFNEYSKWINQYEPNDRQDAEKNVIKALENIKDHPEHFWYKVVKGKPLLLFKIEKKDGESMNLVDELAALPPPPKSDFTLLNLSK